MARQVYNNFQGLHSDPNPESQAPQGGLEVGENIIIQRAGMIEPRPGFSQDSTLNNLGTEATIRQFFQYEGELFALRYQHSGGDYTVWRISDGVEIDKAEDTSTALPFTPTEDFFALAKKSMFMTTNEGIRQLANEQDDVALYAGLPFPGNIEIDITNNGTGLTNGFSVAVRAVYEREVNDQTLQSPPSDREVASNSSGVGKRVDVTVQLHPSLIAGDKVVIYATGEASTAAATGDVMQRYSETVLTSGDITAKEVTVQGSSSLVSFTGDALYTNATQQGIAQANYPPPGTKCLTWFNQMMFYGNTRDVHRITIPNVNANLDALDPAGASLGGFSSGSPNFTDTTFTNTQVNRCKFLTDELSGDYTSAGPAVPSNTELVSYTSPNGVMSNNASSTQASVDIFYFPSVTIDGDEYVANLSANVDETDFKFATSTSGSNADVNVSLKSLARTIIQSSTNNLWAYVTAELDSTGAIQSNTLIVEQPFYNNDSFTLVASTDFSNDSTVDTSSTITSTQETFPDRVYISKLGIPQAVPLTNFISVGSDTEEILQLAAIRDSLFVFKQDGIYRITGRSPSTIRVDEYDQTVTLLNPKAIQMLSNEIYAWTDHGVISMSDVGIRKISNYQIENKLKTLELAARKNLRLENINSGIKQIDEFFFLILPVDSTDNQGKDIYSFCTKTQTWTIWNLDIGLSSGNNGVSALITNETTQRIWLGGDEESGGSSPSDRIFVENDPAASTYNTDNINTATISAIDDSTFTLPSGFSPEKGAVLIQGGAVGILTSLVSGDDWTVQVLTGSFSVASADLYPPITAIIQPTSVLIADSAFEKHYRETELSFFDNKWISNIDIQYETDVVPTGETTSLVLSNIANTNNAKRYRIGVPRKFQRNAHLLPRTTIPASGPWKLISKAMVFEPVSEKGT